jgi:hypothetical protein
MGFWNFFFGKLAKIYDAFFGDMTFMEISSDPAKSYFECERYFRPIAGIIELSVTGSLSGPTQVQKDFFTQLEENYPLIIAAVIPVIEDEFRNWKAEFRIGSFELEFKLVGLSIPTCDQHPIEWEIAFETVHDLNHTIFIAMQEYQPLHILIDG